MKLPTESFKRAVDTGRTQMRALADDIGWPTHEPHLGTIVEREHDGRVYVKIEYNVHTPPHTQRCVGDILSEMGFSQVPLDVERRYEEPKDVYRKTIEDTVVQLDVWYDQSH